MAQRIVILGGGTGGTLVANRLRKSLAGEATEIVVVDRDDRHVYQPGLLFVPFGLATVDEIVRSRRAQLHSGIRFIEAEVDHIEVDGDRVVLADGTGLDYDALVVATGAVLQPGETEGLADLGHLRRVHTFYEPTGAAALGAALSAFEGGRLVVNMIDMPIKCPVAPLEFGFLADWYFRERGIRDRVELTCVTPLDSAFTKPVSSERIGGLLSEKGIELVTEFNTGEVDDAGGRLVSYDGREVAFDLAAVIPLHGGAPFITRSPGLGDAVGFVETDQATLQAKVKPNIFAIGDAAGVPASKAGSVTHFEGEVLVENLLRHLDGQPLDATFDGHTNCFIETGFHKALLIDFNYDTEPLPGHFPGVAGLPLLKESRLNHLGKLMFQWFYWHVLLPGRDVPGLGSDMPQRGKERVSA